MVIDQLNAKRVTTLFPIDSFDGKIGDIINVEDNTFHFAKQKDLTGTSEIVADNGVEEPIISLGVSGNTSQKQYQGYQQVGFKDFTTSKTDSNGNVLNIECKDGIITLNGKTNSRLIFTFDYTNMTNRVLKAGTYTFTGVWVRETGENGIIGNSGGGEFRYDNIETQTPTYASFGERTVLTFESDVRIGYIKPSLTTNQDLVNAKFAIGVFKGDVATADFPPYEPYVGGIPSPNPQYPQEIENANNEGMGVSLHGDNLFDISKVTGANLTTTTTPDVAGNAQYGTITDGVMHLRWATYANRTIWTGAKIPIKQGGKYYLSAEFLVGSDIVTTNVKALYSLFNYTKNTGTGWASVSFPNERDTWVSKTLMISSVPDDWIGDDVYLSLQSGGTAEQYSNIPMYAKNVIISYDEARDYEPYFREEIAIPTSVEVEGATVDLRFAKQGEKADKLIVDKISGKVTYEQWVKTEPLPITSATWGVTTTANQVNTLRVSTYLFNSYSGIRMNEGLLINKFKEIFDLTLDEQSFYLATGSLLGWIGIRVNRDLLETQDSAGVKKWLQTQQDNGDPVLVNYALMTPITHDITNTDLGQSLLALATGKGTNYLEITSNLAPSQTDLSYWRQIIPNE